MSLVSQCQPAAAAYTISDLVECITVGNMVLYINDIHILYYHMDAVMSIMLRYTYFTCSDYLVV